MVSRQNNTEQKALKRCKRRKKNRSKKKAIAVQILVVIEFFLDLK